MNDLPHGLTPEDIKHLEELDSNIQVGPDITYDEYIGLVRWLLRRRRGAGAAGLTSSILLSPSVLSVPTGSPIGTVVGTLSVVNGFGTYTFSFLSNPGSYFTIVGNQIRVGATLPPPQAIPVQIQADNLLGDRPTITTTITITTAGYVPTYYIYGF
jgi:hypothetical protein